MVVGGEMGRWLDGGGKGDDGGKGNGSGKGGGKGEVFFFWKGGGSRMTEVRC